MLHLTEGNERIPKVDYKGYHMNIRLFSELAMSDGWLDSTMQAINDRIKSPLWGYIILAWVWFNWPNLAMLFMSDAPVKFRIDYILSQEFFMYIIC